MIQVQGLNKSFNGVQILEDINIDFQKGKVNMVIGQSGSGKSVLTKCIVGLHEPEQGAVIYDGANFTQMNKIERREIRKKIGMLFQGSALFDSLSVEENIKFPLRMFTKMSEEEMKDRVNFCLKRVNIENKNNLFPSEISGGMQKRVGIARAISLEPQYLFCDEPNSGLDPKTSIVIDNLIKDITQEFDITTVVISHDMNSVVEIGDHIHFIYKGKKHWSGDHKQMIATDNPEINDFVYASEFMKELKDILKSR